MFPSRCRSGDGRGRNIIEHTFGEPAGEGVLLAGMVAAQKRVRAGRRLDTVAETRPWTHRLAEKRQDAEKPVPGEASQADDAAHAAQQTQLADQIR